MLYFNTIYMETNESTTSLQSVILELEKKFSYFKKMDVFNAVSKAYKKVHPLFSQQHAKNELEEIKKVAISDLSHSLN